MNNLSFCEGNTDQFLQFTGYLGVLCMLVGTGTLPANYWTVILLCLHCCIGLLGINWYCPHIAKSPCFHLSNCPFCHLAFHSVSIHSQWEIHTEHCSYPVLTSWSSDLSVVVILFKFVIIFLRFCNFTPFVFNYYVLSKHNFNKQSGF